MTRVGNLGRRNPGSANDNQPSSRKSPRDCAAPTIIIPVYNAIEELEACLSSVAATVGSNTQVIVIDDASPDPRILPLIERTVAAGGPRWRAVRQPRNLGFVETANLGIRLAHSDVVLLNSDTVVTPGWLERIDRCLASDGDIATCTPWSNNGEIVSIPLFCQSNPAPSKPEAVASAIVEAVERLGGPDYPEIPTAVGFCMGISRSAIDSVGFFDGVCFGRGYGEENDFSLRAEAAGFRNVLCDDAYVVHHGGRSFGPLGLKPDEASMRRLLELHPGYRRKIEAFIEADPLEPRREQIYASVIDAGVTFG